MSIPRINLRLLFALYLISAFSLSAWALEANSLKVGVAKVDITPTDLTHLNPMGYGTMAGVHDPLFARVLVIDNGSAIVALVALDLIETGDTLKLRGRIQKELAIPIDHIIITASHSHSAPRIGKPTPGSLDKLGSPEYDAYTETTNEKIFGAISQAKGSMQPARLGIGTGSADVNRSRDLYTPQGWKAGYSTSGPSDKTVTVMKFETMAGLPIAVIMNYAVHPTVTLGTNQISADLAGATERYVEEHFDNKVVALWTPGSAGDQEAKLVVANGDRNRTAGPGRPSQVGQGKSPTPYEAMAVQGFMLGAEVVRVANDIEPKVEAASIYADERVFSCPLRDGIEKLGTFHQSPTGTVPIRIGVVIIGDIAFATVGGEVVTNIYRHLKKASPFTNTILIELTNDRTGYYVDDATYDTNNFEVLASPAAKGCAEDGIVNGIVSMLDGRRQE